MSAVAPPEPANDKDSDDNSADKRKPIQPDQIHDAVLWHDPGQIAAEDLFYGQGGKQGQPVPPFRFEEEVRQDRKSVV